MAVAPRIILTAGFLCLVYAQSDNCGTSVSPLVIHGRPIGPGEYPWLAAIYQQDDFGKWEQICGGALLSPRIVLTAAHCLVSSTRELVDEKKLKVGLGKLYRDFYKNEDYSNIVNVIQIVIPKRYLGTASSFALDVGLLKLETVVETSDYILPVCIDLNTKTSVFTGTTVYAAGWGKSENESSTEKAHAADLSYLDYSSCIFQVRVAYRKYLTHDKFCSLSINGSQVDRGDSGGALTLYKNGRHFVIGVVSTKVTGETAFSIFTDLSTPEIHVWLKWQKKMLDEGESQLISTSKLNIARETTTENGKCVRKFLVTGNGIQDTFNFRCFTDGDDIDYTNGTLFAVGSLRDNFILISNTPSTLTVILNSTCTKNTYFNNNKTTTTMPKNECFALLNELRSLYNGKSSENISNDKMKIEVEITTENGKCVRKFLLTGNGIQDTFSFRCYTNGDDIDYTNGTLFAVGALRDHFILISNTPSTLTVILNSTCTKNTYFNNNKTSTTMPQNECFALLNELRSLYDGKSSEHISNDKMKIEVDITTENGKCVRKFQVRGNGIQDTFTFRCYTVGDDLDLNDGTILAVGSLLNHFILISNTRSTLIVILNKSCTKKTYFNNNKISTTMPQNECSPLLNELYSRYNAYKQSID